MSSLFPHMHLLSENHSFQQDLDSGPSWCSPCRCWGSCPRGRRCAGRPLLCWAAAGRCRWRPACGGPGSPEPAGTSGTPGEPSERRRRWGWPSGCRASSRWRTSPVSAAPSPHTEPCRDSPTRHTLFIFTSFHSLFVSLYTKRKNTTWMESVDPESFSSSALM